MQSRIVLLLNLQTDELYVGDSDDTILVGRVTVVFASIKSGTVNGAIGEPDSVGNDVGDTDSVGDRVSYDWMFAQFPSVRLANLVQFIDPFIIIFPSRASYYGKGGG